MASRKIILDTNIISETLKKSPDEKVLAWLLQNKEHLFLSAITVAELFEGAYRSPVGKRRENLVAALEMLISGYENRILSFNGLAAQTYARMQEKTRHSGCRLTVEDGMIAAICNTEKAILATRNTKDFVHLDLALVNPFKESTPDIVEVLL